MNATQTFHVAFHPIYRNWIFLCPVIITPDYLSVNKCNSQNRPTVYQANNVIFLTHGRKEDRNGGAELNVTKCEQGKITSLSPSSLCRVATFLNKNRPLIQLSYSTTTTSSTNSSEDIHTGEIIRIISIRSAHS